MRRWGANAKRRSTSFCRRTSARRSEACSLRGAVGVPRPRSALSRVAIVGYLAEDEDGVGGAMTACRVRRPCRRSRVCRALVQASQPAVERCVGLGGSCSSPLARAARSSCPASLSLRRPRTLIRARVLSLTALLRADNLVLVRHASSQSNSSRRPLPLGASWR